MGKLDRVMLAALCLLLGCGTRGGEQASATQKTREPDPSKLAAGARAHDPRFDAEGKLREGDRRVGWLVLPSGFEELPGDEPRTSRWRGPKLSLEQARAYFDERLRPKNANFLPRGFHYERAVPSYTELEQAPISVTLQEIGSTDKELSLTLVDHTPMHGEPLPPEAAQELLSRKRHQLE